MDGTITIINGAATNPVVTPTFAIGERVVHPQHGVGHVVKLESREFERGVIRQYYEVSMPGGSTVWVPVDLSNSGLRGLAEKREIVRCRKILGAPPVPLTEDGKVRQSELVERLKQGTLAAQCEVVRDLSAFVSHRPSYGTISTFLQATQAVLFQEWAAVEEITISEAAAEISALLEQGIRDPAAKPR